MENSLITDLLNEEFGCGYPLEPDDQWSASQDDTSALPTAPSPQRRDALLPRTTALQSTNLWDPRLVLDMAIGVDDLSTMLARYDLSEEEFHCLSNVPAFRRELALTMREVRENGLSFERKARIQAESYLEIMDHLVYSDTTPANVRLETIRSAVKWAKLEPKESKGDGDTNATQINVQINF